MQIDSEILSRAVRYVFFDNYDTVNSKLSFVPTEALENDGFSLTGSNSTDPDGQILTFIWNEDDSNPEAIGIDGFTGSTFNGDRPTTPGEYYYTVTANDPDGMTM